jgi:16S rRNA processing protein RimM
MARTSGSTSSTDRKPAKPARSEPARSPSASDERARGPAGPAKPARSEAKPSEGGPPQDGLLLIGKVVGAHGLHGLLRLQLSGEVGSALTPGARLALASEEPGARDLYAVSRAAPGRRGEWRVQLDGVTSRDEAEALRGRQVFLDASCLAELPEGEYYGYQLLGCRLEGEDGTRVGRVRDIWETGASDVLVVEGDDGREHLVPAALLREVDLEARRALIEILPGLLESD